MSIASNKRAYYDYFIEEKYEAGIELKGTEVKSVKMGKISLNECHIRVMKDEVFIINMYIGTYEQGNRYNVEERRSRKLLLHRKEIAKLHSRVVQNGMTIVPISVYLKKGMIKLEIAIGKGKKMYDKRDELSKQSQKREIERAEKDFSRS